MLTSLIQSIKQYYCLFSFISFFSLFVLIGCEAETPLEYETKPERADKIEQKETENNKGGSTAPMESHVFAKGVIGMIICRITILSRQASEYMLTGLLAENFFRG